MRRSKRPKSRLRRKIPQRFQLDRRQANGKRFPSPCSRKRLRTRRKAPREFQNPDSSAASGPPHWTPAGIESRNWREEPSWLALMEKDVRYGHHSRLKVYARLRCPIPASFGFVTVAASVFPICVQQLAWKRISS